MADEPRILKLLEQVLDSELTPEELCVDCPELLPSLKDKLARFRSMDAQLEDLFPSSRFRRSKDDPLISSRNCRKFPDMTSNKFWAAAASGSFTGRAISNFAAASH